MSIIVGIVIGAGVYETAPLVFANVSSAWMALVVWTLGGALSLVGACCYAELASAYPHSGGDFVYLTKAYGRFAGFIFAWVQLVVLMTGSIGMMAYIFADYAVAGLGLAPSATAPCAALVVAALTAMNIAGISVGKSAQNVLSSVKILGLVIIIFAGFLAVPGAPARPSDDAANAGAFPLAMIMVLYTFGGWNDAAFVASEVRDRHKNLPRALIYGTLLVTVVYVLVNAAFVRALGFERARGSVAIASEVLDHAFGAWGGAFMAGLVMISALGATNALVFTGSRVHARLGSDFRNLAVLGRWNSRRGSPVGALVVQLAVTLVLIGGVGTATGRRGIDWVLAASGLSATSWSRHGGFDMLLRCTAPLFWLFFALTALSTIVLRWRDPERPRPFRVPLYPLLPCVFAVTCFYMLHSAVLYAGGLTLIGALPALCGIPIYFIARRAQRPTDRSSAPFEHKESYHEAI